MDQIAIRYPDLRIVVMAHMGDPRQADTCAVIRTHPHVYADDMAGIGSRSSSFYEALRKVAEWHVLDKLRGGSAYSVSIAEENINALRAVNRIVEGTDLPRVPEEALEAIVHRNRLTLLGIEW